MADFTQIIQEINDDITTNGVGAITGEKLNEVLRDMIAAVNQAKADMEAEGSIFGGWITSPDDQPTQGNDKRYFYYAQQAGTYVYFNNIVLDGDFLAMLYWNESTNQWISENIALSGNGLANVLNDYIREESLFLILGFKSFETWYSYSEGDWVSYEGNLYQFTANHPAGQWDDNDVVAYSLVDYITDYVSKQLSGKQDTISDLATIRSGAAAGATAYQKPSGGIPKTDLASGVQTSLGKADTAFQKPSGGIPASDLTAAVQTSLGKADTAVQTETDPVFSASPAAGITSGDISDWDAKANPIPVVDASTIPASMDADKVYQYGTLSGNTTFPALNTPTDLTVAHVYCWTFTTPSTAPTITWPSAITSWAGGSAPTINASKSYEVSVMDGFATIIEN